MIFEYANVFTTTLATAIGPNDDIITVANGTGALAPSIVSGMGRTFALGMRDSDQSPVVEVAHVTQTLGDTFHVARAAEPVNGAQVRRSFQAGAVVCLIQSTEAIRQFAQKDEIQGSGFDYGTCIGSPNVYIVTLEKAPTMYRAGMGLRFIVPPGQSSTGSACVVNVNGLGNVPIVLHDNTAPAPYDLAEGEAVDMTYSGAAFVLHRKRGRGPVINASTNYPVTWADHGGRIIAAAPVTITLPSPSVVGSGFTVDVESVQAVCTVNTAAGIIVSSCTEQDSATSITIPVLRRNLSVIRFVSDGASWRATAGGESRGRFVVSGPAAQVIQLPPGVRSIFATVQAPGGSGYNDQTCSASSGAFVRRARLDVSCASSVTVAIPNTNSDHTPGKFWPNVTISNGATQFLSVPCGQNSARDSSTVIPGYPPPTVIDGYGIAGSTGSRGAGASTSVAGPGASIIFQETGISSAGASGLWESLIGWIPAGPGVVIIEW